MYPATFMKKPRPLFLAVKVSTNSPTAVKRLAPVYSI
jgi:hypothetical protein